MNSLDCRQPPTSSQEPFNRITFRATGDYCLFAERAPAIPLRRIRFVPWSWSHIMRTYVYRVSITPPSPSRPALELQDTYVFKLANRLSHHLFISFTARAGARNELSHARYHFLRILPSQRPSMARLGYGSSTTCYRARSSTMLTVLASAGENPEQAS